MEVNVRNGDGNRRFISGLSHQHGRWWLGWKVKGRIWSDELASLLPHHHHHPPITLYPIIPSLSRVQHWKCGMHASVPLMPIPSLTACESCWTPYWCFRDQPPPSSTRHRARQRGWKTEGWMSTLLPATEPKCAWSASGRDLLSHPIRCQSNRSPHCCRPIH